MRIFYKLFTVIVSVFAASAAFADYPRPWQLGFQEAVTPVMEEVVEFHNLLLVVIFAISAFVLALLTYTCIKFSAKNNPVPSRNTHNTLLEVVWTALPVVILVAICIPSMKLLYFAEKVENSEMTLKIIGNQWYWSYQYPDHGDISFDSNIIKDEDLKPGQLRLLETDNHVVLPVDTNIRLQLTASDVIHNWAIPAFGVKTDATPGRLSESWIKVTKTGTYYGQCSELCGVGHGFMPIVVDIVSKEQFAVWTAKAKKKFADGGNSEEFAVAQ